MVAIVQVQRQKQNCVDDLPIINIIVLIINTRQVPRLTSELLRVGRGNLTTSTRVPRSSSLGPQGLQDHVQGPDLELAGLREALGHQLDEEEQALWDDVLRHARQDHHFVGYCQKRIFAGHL